MPLPSSLDTFGGTTSSGTSLLTSPDHSLDHRVLGSAANGIQNLLGTSTGGTSILKNFTTGAFAARTNNETFGSPTINGGTASGYQDTYHTLGSVALSPGTSTTGTLVLNTGNRFLINMPNSAGSVTLAVSSVTVNQPFIVEILQGTAGLGTINFFSTIRWAGSAAPIQTLTASRKDTFGFIATGTAPTFDGYIIGQNV